MAISNRKNVYNVINSIFWVSNFKKTRMEFVKRLAQQESLRNALASPHSDFIVMYGRRRLLWHPLPTRRMWSMYFSFGKNRFLLLCIARSCFQRTWQRCWNNINVQFTQCHGSPGQKKKRKDCKIDFLQKIGVWTNIFCNFAENRENHPIYDHTLIKQP